MIPITSNHKMEKIFLDICGPVSYTHLDVYKRQPIPTLPVNNVIIIGAAGRQNKTVKKQVSLDLANNNMTLPIGLLVATGLPFNVLIGCDVLRQHSAVIDLHKGIISLTSEEGLWTAELIDTNRTVPVNTRCLAIKSYFCKKNKIPEVIQYEDDDPELWQSKLEEVREFQREKTCRQVSKVQAENLIQIYNKYKHVFSNAPGKVKGYQCDKF